jgi:hypothetical protein
MSRFPGTDRTFEDPNHRFCWRSGVGVKSRRAAGSTGKFQSVLSHWGGSEPSHDRQYFGGSR